VIGRILLFLLCAILALLLVALLIPAYVRVSYEQGEPSVIAKYAWLTIPIYPRESKEAAQEPTEKETSGKEQKETPSRQKSGINWEQIQYSLDTLPPVLLKALKRTGRRIRIEPLKVHVLIATADPADTAILYGKIHAVLAAALPTLHRLVRIREQDIQLFPDFCENEMDFIVDAGIGIRPWDLLAIGLCALGGIFKWFLGFRKRATKFPETNDNNVETTAHAETAA